MLTTDASAKAKAWYLTGYIHMEQEEYKNAYISMHYAHHFYLEAGDMTRAARANNVIANLYLIGENYEKAHELYDENLSLFLQADNQRDLAITYFNQGLVSVREKSYEASINYFSKADDLFNSIDDAAYVNKSRVYIADIYHRIGNFDESNQMIESLLNSKTVDDFVIVNAKVVKGRIHSDMGEQALAESHFQEALALASETSLLTDAQIASNNLAELFEAQNLVEKAAKQYEYTISFSTNLNRNSFTETAYKRSADLYSALGNTARSSELSKAYSELLSSDLWTSVNQQQLKAKMEIQLGENLVITQQIEDQYAKERLYKLTILALSIIILVFVGWRALANRRKVVTIKSRASDTLKKYGYLD